MSSSVVILFKMRNATASYYRNCLSKFFSRNNLDGVSRFVMKETKDDLSIVCCLPNLRLAHKISRIIKIVHHRNRPSSVDAKNWEKNLEIFNFHGDFDLQGLMRMLS